ncbi:MAG: RdgB/HAM1 family non-canonical purine NTP pyrophosphatase [Actinomycetota bacterium]|nr:RdgB/HAM1 family non-canonical purine NTP pyrophosphatase [Actinomycetota bacterium]
MMDIAIASRNRRKVEEIRKALIIPGLSIHTFEEFEGWSPPVESGETFEENATLKALSLFDHTGIPSLSDDSGLMVDSLGGRPGVYSSRYAGVEGDAERNIELLLSELEVIPFEKRRARFVCVIALVLSPDCIHLATGICEGHILTERKGSGGFGYDPVFQPEGYSRSMAELTLDEKNAISHRGRALSEMRKVIEKMI